MTHQVPSCKQMSPYEGNGDIIKYDRTMVIISSRAGDAVVLGTASDVIVHLLVEELGGHFRLQV